MSNKLEEQLYVIAGQMHEAMKLIKSLPVEEKPSDDLFDAVSYIRETAYNLLATSNHYLEG